jgi:hypothetical protein
MLQSTASRPTRNLELLIASTTGEGVISAIRIHVPMPMAAGSMLYITDWLIESSSPSPTSHCSVKILSHLISARAHSSSRSSAASSLPFLSPRRPHRRHNHVFAIHIPFH